MGENRHWGCVLGLSFAGYAEALSLFEGLPSSPSPSSAELSYGCCLLQCPGGVNILLDTSLGCIQPPISPAMTVTRPLQDLRVLLKEAAGLAPEDISVVVHTHLHRCVPPAPCTCAPPLPPCHPAPPPLMCMPPSPSVASGLRGQHWMLKSESP